MQKCMKAEKKNFTIIIYSTVIHMYMYICKSKSCLGFAWGNHHVNSLDQFQPIGRYSFLHFIAAWCAHHSGSSVFVQVYRYKYKYNVLFIHRLVPRVNSQSGQCWTQRLHIHICFLVTTSNAMFYATSHTYPASRLKNCSHSHFKVFTDDYWSLTKFSRNPPFTSHLVR